MHYFYSKPHEVNYVTKTSMDRYPLLLHQRLGHANFSRVNAILKVMKMSEKLAFKEAPFCTACAIAKTANKKYPKQARHVAKRILERISADVCGPFAIRTPHHERYFAIFVDEFTRYVKVTLLKQKSEFEAALLSFIEQAENLHQPLRVSIIRTDGGGEMNSNQFNKTLKSKGIKREINAPYAHGQNGMAERAIRTVVESAQAMRSHAGLPPTFWGHAVKYSAYIYNHIPRKVDSMKDKRPLTPIELWESFEADSYKQLIEHLRVFGCETIAYKPTETRRKIDYRGERAILLGIADDSKAYSLVSSETKRFFIARTVVCDETRFPYTEARNLPLLEDDLLGAKRVLGVNINDQKYDQNLDSDPHTPADQITDCDDPDLYHSDIHSSILLGEQLQGVTKTSATDNNNNIVIDVDLEEKHTTPHHSPNTHPQGEAPETEESAGNNATAMQHGPAQIGRAHV